MRPASVPVIAEGEIPGGERWLEGFDVGGQPLYERPLRIADGPLPV
jgi:hypothetical protein